MSSPRTPPAIAGRGAGGSALDTRVTRHFEGRPWRASLVALLGHRLARVALVGATSAGVDFAVFNLLMWPLDLRETAHVLGANSVAFWCAMVVNYALNARYSFGVAPTRRSMVAYVAFTAFGLLLYNANLLWIREVFSAVSPVALNASKVAAMAILVVWNYFGYQRFVFGPDTPAHARSRPAR